VVLKRLMAGIFEKAATAAPAIEDVEPLSDRLRDVLPPLPVPSQQSVFNFFAPMHWGVSDLNTVSECAKRIVDAAPPGHYFGDNLLTWGRNMSMLDDAPFVKAWDSNVESDADKAILWRRYVLACAAYHCIQLDGDFVECGAYTGVGMKTIVDYLGGEKFPKTFWGYDVFEHDESMRHHSMPAHGSNLFDRVTAKFQGYRQVRLVKGLIPESFQLGCPDTISYLHIDLNEAPAEVAALDHLFHRVVPGGIVVLDDYEWAMDYRNQKLQEDRWFEKRHYRVMPLPTGQGLVFKR